MPVLLLLLLLWFKYSAISDVARIGYSSKINLDTSTQCSIEGLYDTCQLAIALCAIYAPCARDKIAMSRVNISAFDWLQVITSLRVLIKAHRVSRI